MEIRKEDIKKFELNHAWLLGPKKERSLQEPAVDKE